jgi:hypothetical protein
MAASVHEGSLLDLPGFEEELAAFERHLFATKVANTMPHRTDDRPAPDRRPEAPTSVPQFMAPDAEVGASRPPARFLCLMLFVGAGLAVLVFHSRL